MAITNFGTLKTAMANWLRPQATPSTDMTARIPEYISMAQGELNDLLADHVRMEVTAALTIVDGYADIPTRLLSVKLIQLSQEPFNEVPPMSTSLPQAYTAAGTPIEYKWSGSKFMFFPPTDASAYIVYKSGFTPFSADGDTDWLLTLRPDAYVYGALRHADRRLVDTERLAMWQSGFESAIGQLTNTAKLAHSGLLRVKPSTSGA